MANVCPNFSSQEWNDLVSEFGGSKILAYMAFEKNGNKIPDITSDIVTQLKSGDLNFGNEIDVILDENGNETDEYKEVGGEKKYTRISAFSTNFAGIKRDRSKTAAQRKADWEWKDLNKDEKKYTEFGRNQTYDEYLNDLNDQAFKVQMRGKLLHLGMESKTSPHKREEIAKKVQEIEDELTVKFGKVPFSWRWILKEGNEEKGIKSVVERIFDRMDINTLHKYKSELDNVLRDEIMSEVSIADETTGLAGRIDTLVRHSDGTYTIIDWKTGASMNKYYKGLNNVLMKYGDQFSTEIEDSVRNRAKLQIALYAVLMRMNNPNMQFRDLKIGWIPNETDGTAYDVDANVDVQAFIPMIEMFFSDEKMMEDAGLPKDMAERMKKKNPSVFKPKYYSSSMKEVHARKVRFNNDKNPKERMQAITDEIHLMIGGTITPEDLSKEDQSRLISLMSEFMTYAETGEGIGDINAKYEDMSIVSMYIGNYSEVKHPMIQIWKKFKDEQEGKMRRKVLNKYRKFETLLSPVMKEYLDRKGIKNILGNRNINYDELYSFAFVNEQFDDELNETRERLLTENETDPELKAKWDTLTKDQQELLKFINKEFKEYFVGERAFFNQTAAIVNGKVFNHIDVYNNEKSAKDRRVYYDGFFAKLPPTQSDIILRQGEGSWLKGAFSLKTARRLLFKYLTFFEENEYDMWQDKTAMPIKYLGNDFIDKSKSYTRNLELIYKRAIAEWERKAHLDSVYSLGQAIILKLNQQKAVDSGEPAYKNLVDWFDTRMLTDIQRRMKMHDARGRGMRIPMITQRGVVYQKISIDSLLRGMTKWASMNTMWLKPWQGTGNGFHAVLLTHREGMKGFISRNLKFLGIDPNSVHFDSKHIAKAEAVFWNDFAKKAITGNIRESKLWLLAEEFNYLGDEFSFHSIEKTMLSMRNRFMTESSMYMFHSLPEEFVSLTTMAAQLMSMKNENTGNSIWKDYDVVPFNEEQPDGTFKKVYKLEWKGGVRGVIKKGEGKNAYTEELKGINDREAAKLRKVHEELQGGYRRDESTYIEAYALGKAVMHLKKYFPRLILNAFHSKRASMDLGYYRQMMDENGNPIYEDKDGNKIPVMEWIARMEEGRWKTLGGHLITVLSMGAFNSGSYKWKNLSDAQKQNVIEAYLTLAILLTMYGAYLKGFGDLDDDDATKKWWKMYLVDNLSQQYNPVDLLKTGKTFVTPVFFTKFTTFVDSGTQMMWAGANYMIGNEDAALTKRGDLKGWNTFAKGLPLVSSYKDTMNRFNNVKDDSSWINWSINAVRLR